MNIDHIAESYGGQSLRSAGLEPKKRVEEKKGQEAESAKSPSDRIQISDEAKALKEKAGLMATALQDLEKAPEPELSNAKVTEVLARIMSDHYNSRQVLESIAASLLDDGMQLAKEAGSTARGGVVDATPDDLSPQRVEQIQNRLDSGFYEQNEVFDAIVRELFS